MDVISVIVIGLAVVGILQRSPKLVREFVEEIRYARNGQESPSASARRQRLIDAGVEPGVGGPARQFTSNWWRDFWLDMDRRRRAKAARRRARGERRSWRDRVDEEFGQRSGQWPLDAPDDPSRSTPNRGTASDDEPASGSGDDSLPDDDGRHPDREPSEGDGPSTGRGADGDTSSPDPGPSTADDYSHDDGRDDFDDGREPIRVEAFTGEPWPSWNPPPTPPIPTPAQPALPASSGTSTAVLEGEPMSTLATTSTPVTGVISGATETASIRRQLDAAVNTFVAELGRVRARLTSLGDQTLSIVQFAGSSSVIGRMVQAAEAAASAQAAANSCASEVGPLLDATKREFEKRNS